MTNIRVDLYSDTQTRPTPAMRQAMAEAPVGDEQRGEDPSVNRLCETVAELLGKEAAMFLPSGTMCNEIALLLHCRPGDEVICDATAHIIIAEGGGPAVFAGAMIRPLQGTRGIFSADDVHGAVRDDGRYSPNSRLVEVEQTSNFGGGTVWPLEAIRSVAQAARDHGLALHMDGARLMNAVVASGVPARDFVEPFDTAWVDLSKGLGCPVGAVLVGSRETIERAWQWKQRMGGAMRQAGIIAAAGTYALAHHVERLAEDHDNARSFAEQIVEIPGISLDPQSVETNIVFFDVAGTGLSADDIGERLLGHGVRVGPMGATTIRAVTHLDVDKAGMDAAAAALRSVVTDR